MTQAAPQPDLLADRRRLLGPNVSMFYEEPVHLVKGEGVWVWDADGRRYLDCYNNVPHVGHCHPKVVEAIHRQASTLNTHTRYLHTTVLAYAQKLTDTFRDPLDTLLMTCTGSEANDVALRMARAVTGARGIIVTDHTYHGNTALVSQLSRTNPPPDGAADFIEYVPAPDSYRDDAASSADAFSQAVSDAIQRLADRGHALSCLLICPFFANEGFPDLPSGWLTPAIQTVRKAGALVIADEVQVGFGRLGGSLWGHQRAGFEPDIVCLGKPMANGHPVAGLVTSTDVMSTFRRQYRYFNTFGGNPVSCAAAMATLEVLQRERLVENAHEVGEYARAGLRRLAQRHPVIGNVRGSGLFFGAEMVLDRESKQPAGEYAARVANAMRHKGVLLNKLGIHYNTLKIRPPMPFSKAHTDILLSTLDEVLTELPLEA